MSIMSKFKSVSNILTLTLVVAIGVLAAKSLFSSGYFIMHDDLQMMRQLEMEKCFLDGQIPCRWVPDMGNGFGFPLFNYYPPLPYLIGELFRIFGLAFTTTVKLTFALSLILSGVSMYLFAKEFFGKIGGVVSSVFYVWAPYHALDIFVRGAMNEGWALVWFPLILLSSYRLVNDAKFEKRWQLLLIISYSLLLMSHNLMVLIFTPILALWVLIHLFVTRNWQRIFPLVIAGFFALGLAAFFTAPSFFEQKYVNVSSLVSDYYDFSGHFATVNQLFLSRYWGDGSSAFGEENDGMSFSLGHIHWFLSLFAGLMLFVKLLFKKGNVINKIKSDKLTLATGFLLLVSWFSAFMAHSRSTPVWQAVDILKFLQFPWRFLTLTILGMAFTIGVIPGIFGFSDSTSLVKKVFGFPIKFVTALVLTIVVIAFNWNFFKPVRVGPVTDLEKFSGEAWRLQQGAGIRDYLPVTAKFDPRERRKTLVEIMDGEAFVSKEGSGTYWARFNVNVASDSAKIRINIFNFPIWRVFMKSLDEVGSGRELPVSVPDEEEWGRMWIEIPRGEYVIYAQLFNTPLRTVSNIISIISLVVLFFYIKSNRVLKFGSG